MPSIIKVDQIQSDTGNVSVVSGNVSITGNVNIDSGVVFVNAVSNRLGVGTTTPTSPLDVNGLIRTTGFVTNPSSGAGMEMAWDGTQGVIQAFSDRATLTVAPVLLNSGQLKFPASQNASTDANTLDDYEEGTWTPVNASIASLTFSVLQANYIKVGRLVHVNCYLNYPSTSDTNQAKIGGLPFPVISAGSNGYSFLGGRIGYASGGHATWQVIPGLNECVGYVLAGGTQLLNSNMSNQYVLLSGTYISNS